MIEVLAVYLGITSIIVLGAGIARIDGDIEGNILSYVFWPFIALNAAIIHIWRMWRE